MFRLSRQYFAIESLSLFIVETLLIGASVVCAIAVRLQMNLSSLQGFENLAPRLLIFTGVFVLCLYYNEFYNGKWKMGLDFFIKLAISQVIASLALMAVYYVLPQFQLGRGIFILANITIFVSFCLWRYFYETMIKRGGLTQNIVIVGTGERARELAKIIEGKKNSGYCFVGFVDGSAERTSRREAFEGTRDESLELPQSLLTAEGR